MLTIISLLITFLIIRYIYKKHTESDLEKTLVEIIGATCIIILAIWYLDKYNIPTTLGIASNIETKEWFDFIMNFLTTMLGTFISAILVLATTIGQLERTEENEQEAHRINNMPFLEYKVSITNNNTLNIKFKNIGNNTIKKYIIKIKNKNILSDYQNCLAVNEESKITYKLPLDEQLINIVVEYQDLLYNTYEQKIDVSYMINSDNKTTMIDKVLIEDEKIKKRKRS